VRLKSLGFLRPGVRTRAHQYLSGFFAAEAEPSENVEDFAAGSRSQTCPL